MLRIYEGAANVHTVTSSHHVDRWGKLRTDCGILVHEEGTRWVADPLPLVTCPGCLWEYREDET